MKKIPFISSIFFLNNDIIIVAHPFLNEFTLFKPNPFLNSLNRVHFFAFTNFCKQNKSIFDLALIPI